MPSENLEVVLAQGLFPEIDEPIFSERLKLHELSDLDCKGSMQARRKGHVCVKNIENWKSESGVPGLWVHALDVEKAKDLAAEIADLRKTRSETNNIESRRTEMDRILSSEFTKAPPPEISRLASRFLESGQGSEAHCDRLLSIWTRYALSKLLKTRSWLSSVRYEHKKGFVLDWFFKTGHSDFHASFAIGDQEAHSLVVKTTKAEFSKRCTKLAAIELKDVVASVADCHLPSFVSDRNRLVPRLVGTSLDQSPLRLLEMWLEDVVSEHPERFGFSIRGTEIVKKVCFVAKFAGIENKVSRYFSYEQLAVRLLSSREDSLDKALACIGEEFAAEVKSRVVELEDDDILISRCLEDTEDYDATRDEFLTFLRPKIREMFRTSPDFLSDGERFAQVLSTCSSAVVAERRLTTALKRCGEELPDTLPEFFPLARSLKRKIKFVLGETNSGKTWRALERLKQSSSGCYLGPLRLLATEIRDTLVDDGVPCSLVTGEYVEVDENAKYVSSTIEMVDFTKEVDVAIIDEAQKFEDPDRGSAWVEAFVGVPAREVWVLGSPACEAPLKLLAERLGEEFEVEIVKRLSPLRVMAESKSLKDLTKGDALIAFSRRTVLDLAAALRTKGKKVSVIYGALSPEVRKEEARRFRDGETDIVVATDAIGMGLNLPVKSVIFFEARKWDGYAEGYVPHEDVKQIGGRAGRYGFHEEGLVGATSPDVLSYIARSMSLPHGSCQPKFGFSPSWRVVSLLSRHLGTNSVGDILGFFLSNFTSFGDGFFPTLGQDRLALAEIVDSYHKLSLRDKFTLSLSPVPKHRHEFDACFKEFVSIVAAGRTLHPAESRYLTTEEDGLEECENVVKRLTLYCWLHYRFPDNFPHLDDARSMISDMETIIIGLLRRTKSRTCNSCGVPLPTGFRFGYCEDCHKSGAGRWR